MMKDSLFEFDEWYRKKNNTPLLFGDVYMTAKSAWIEATRREREACAKTCEELFSFDEYDPGQSAAEAIRARDK